MPQPASESPVRRIVGRFGSARALGALLEPENADKGAARVRNWVYENSIPAWHHQRVVEAAARAGIEVTHAELAAIAEEARQAKADLRQRQQAA
jgi:hypothetical protein